MKVWLAPVGRVSKGHVLDVALKPFERALRDQDDRLYVQWNPRKLKGHGCWEIRIRPSQKTALYAGSYNGSAIYMLDYVEYNDIHHVLDCAFLNYDVIRKLKEMDTGNKKHFIHDLEYLEKTKNAELMEKARQDQAYNLKQHRTALRDLYERVRSGENLHRIIGEHTWT